MKIKIISDIHITDEDKLNHSKLTDDKFYNLIIRELKDSELFVINGDFIELYQSKLPTLNSRIQKYNQIRIKFPKLFSLIENDPRVLVLAGNHDEIITSLLKNSQKSFRIKDARGDIVIEHGVHDFTGKHFPKFQYYVGWIYGWIERLSGIAFQHSINRWLERKFNFSFFSNKDQIKAFKKMLEKDSDIRMMVNGHTHLSEYFEFIHNGHLKRFINTGAGIYGMTKVTTIDLSRNEIYLNHERQDEGLEYFIASLQPGDIILSKGNSTKSEILTNIFEMKYSHAMLYIGNGKVIEAVPEGVKISKLRYYLNNDYNLAILRLKSGNKKLLIKNIKAKLGIPYSFLGVIYGALLHFTKKLFRLNINDIIELAGKDLDKKEFCSELIAWGINETFGIKILKGKNHLVTTEDLYKSNLFIVINEVKR